ncbi:hypothetical protein [Mycobacteroides abscessus]|uniref:hypothetical protein n=1 Tax=Mycobacteroides abscessus TaxID=36809 RepID=UPI000DBB4D4D|nr:hypothetical protein [Mycobacteroides abscessus]BBB42829.1 hypothetical protein MASB_33950 [Mycobacteroides abscessus subsp. bolletii BD]
MTDNPICICGDHFSQHVGDINPKSVLSNCPGFESRPESERRQPMSDPLFTAAKLLESTVTRSWSYRARLGSNGTDNRVAE